MHEVTTTRRYVDGTRLHLHQLVTVDWEATTTGEDPPPRLTPSRYIVTSLDGSLRLTSLPLGDDSKVLTIDHSKVPKHVGRGLLRAEYRGPAPVWGY